MKKISVLIAAVLISLSACNNAEEATSQNQLPEITPLVEKVLTADEQAALTPEAVLQSLKDGNLRFISSNLTARDHSSQVRQSATGQFPKAVVLSCLDSRVPVEDVFDKGIGDMFVARVAGNFVNEDILGSMEFGCKVAGSKLILVMGHESCGAVKASIDKVELGNITAMLTKINPAVEMTESFDGEKLSSNPAYVHAVCENNVKNTVEQIKQRSPILNEMLQNGEIMIVGAVYDMDTGEVKFL